MRVNCARQKQITLTEQVRIGASHQILTLSRGTISAMILPCDLDERDAMTPENPLLAVQDAHGLLLDGQMVVQLQLRIIQHVRWVRDVFFEHGHMKYIVDLRQGGR